LFQLGQQEILAFPFVQNIRTYDDTYNPDDGLLASVYIRYDARYNIYNRQVYSILQLLGDVGGL
jgi:hypothetical protein